MNGEEDGGESCDESRVMGCDWAENSVLSVVKLEMGAGWRKMGADTAGGASGCEDDGSGALAGRKPLFGASGGWVCAGRLSRTWKEAASGSQKRTKQD